ncbi:DUF397 domain-containing protein [Streptomyces sp. NPDC006175]|uniref:DUF397 domain-containing protein n=1 Tax=Streptomyces sp. NPDC006175 TaxID=3154471 RepID=UPI0033B58266
MSHVSDVRWVKSSFSDAGGNNCVEVAAVKDEGLMLRESDHPGTVLTTKQSALRALVLAIKSGDT